MRRTISLSVLLVLLAYTWSHGVPVRQPIALGMRVEAVVRPRAEQLRRLGPFRLEGIWVLHSGSAMFGGYSALLAVPGNRWIAVSDSGMALRFTPPDRPGPPPQAMRLELGLPKTQQFSDIESATRDPATGRLWMALEGRNAIVRLSRDFVADRPVVRPRAMSGWGGNTGAESLVRLADGRFLTVRETPDLRFLAATGNQGLLFSGDPVAGGTPLRFRFEGPRNFSVTDMAQLPDGRVLVLMRKVVWPMPIRLAGRIAIGDPAQIRAGGVWRTVEVARLASTLPVDNFEGMTVEPLPGGRLAVWLISDDNHAQFQRTLLWKLTVDPARLPRF